MHERLLAMLLSDAGLKTLANTDTAYHNEEPKSLTRYRFDKVKECAKLKSSVSRLVCILFPELEKLVPTLHMASVYALLEVFLGAKQIAAAHLTRLKSTFESFLQRPLQTRYGFRNSGCCQKFHRFPDACQVPSDYSTPSVSSVN